MKKTFISIFVGVVLILVFSFYTNSVDFNFSYIKKGVEGVFLGGDVTEKENFLYPVIWVYDGDTFSVKKNGKNIKVRVLGINTPEVEGKYKKEECFGKEASKKAKELLSGKKVYLKTDVSQDEFDKYGRMLAYVFLEDNLFFNKEMIREGYAYEYTFKGRAYKYQDEFKKAENKAKKTNLGLWGKCY